MAEGEDREFEIKLAFDPADLAAIESHPLLAALPVQKETLVSVYYDTEDRLLWKARLALRVRKIGSRYVQTLKGADGGAELFDRPEWEQETSSLEPDLRLAANTPLACLLDGAPAGRVMTGYLPPRPRRCPGRAPSARGRRRRASPGGC